MKLLKNKLTLTGFFIVVLLTLIAIFAPIIARYDYNAIDLRFRLLPPSNQHWFGTDLLGRDLFSRIVWGTRISLIIGFVAVGISTFIGVFLGAIAGYYGKWADTVIMRFIDIMLCFPTFFLLLAVISILEPGLINIMVVIGLTSWMGVARLIRAEILSLKQRTFIEAARAIGASDFRIIIRHLIPNAIGPVIVNATLSVAAAVLVESSLSFLGIGVQPPIPSWGNILTDAKGTLGVAWWMTLFPGMAIFITVVGYNLLGEGLREQFNLKNKNG